MAYNLQYMFREDIDLATTKFYQALEASPIDQPYELKDMFGSERKMFDELLGRALKIYGKGLIDQKALAKTDFANNPTQLVEVVEKGMGEMQPKVKLIAQMTAEWMRMLIAADKMPLTPHHTQVLAMLMFSEFYDQKTRLSQSINTGGYNCGHFEALLHASPAWEHAAFLLGLHPDVYLTPQFFDTAGGAFLARPNARS